MEFTRQISLHFYIEFLGAEGSSSVLVRYLEQERGKGGGCGMISIFNANATEWSFERAFGRADGQMLKAIHFKA